MPTLPDETTTVNLESQTPTTRDWCNNWTHGYWMVLAELPACVEWWKDRYTTRYGHDLAFSDYVERQIDGPLREPLPHKKAGFAEGQVAAVEALLKFLSSVPQGRLMADDYIASWNAFLFWIENYAGWKEKYFASERVRPCHSPSFLVPLSAYIRDRIYEERLLIHAPDFTSRPVPTSASALEALLEVFDNMHEPPKSIEKAKENA